jgi:hypothetical protein
MNQKLYEQIELDSVFCRECQHTVKKFKLPKVLPEKVTLRCSKCKGYDVLFWVGGGFEFENSADTRKVECVYHDIDFDTTDDSSISDVHQEVLISNEDLERDRIDALDSSAFDFSDQNTDSLSPIEWDDAEEDWTSS